MHAVLLACLLAFPALADDAGAEDDASEGAAGGGSGADGALPGHEAMRDSEAMEEVREAHGGQTPWHNPKPTGGRTDLTAAREALFRALSPRAVAPPCSGTDEIADDPVTDYIWLVDHVGTPPWVPQRAASCLLEDHADDPAVAEAMRRWMTDPTSQGVALLILDRIDELPEPLAVDLARIAATEGPNVKEARARLRRSSRKSVRQAWR